MHWIDRFTEYTNEELIIVMRILDDLMEMDEHLLETSPSLKYAPFRSNNRMIRYQAHDSMKGISFDERLKYREGSIKELDLDGERDE